MKVLIITALLLTLVWENVAAITCAEQFRKAHKSKDQRKEIAKILDAATILSNNTEDSCAQVTEAQKIIDGLFNLYFSNSPLKKEILINRFNILNLYGVENKYCLPSYIFTKGELSNYYLNYTDSGKLRIDVLIENRAAKLNKIKNIANKAKHEEGQMGEDAGEG